MRTATVLSLVFICALYPSLSFAGSPNSGFTLSDVSATGKAKLHLEYVIRNSQAWDLDLVLTYSGSKQYKETNVVVNPCFAKAPKEQPSDKHYANLTYSTPPLAYQGGGVIGWIVAVNNGTAPGSVLVRALRLWGIDPAGTRHLVANDMICELCDSADDKVWGYDMLRSLWLVPSAWDQPNHGSVFQILSGGVIKIPTSSKPLDLFHFWNTLWPRPAVQPGWSYEVEAEVLPRGAGMIQIGLDYWTSTSGGTNTEAANSNWVCSSSDANWVTIRAGVQ